MDWIFQSANTIARAVSNGRASAKEVLTAHLAQIDAHNHAINAVVAMDREAAFAVANDIDARRTAGKPIGLLAGVPVTIKEAFDCEGLPATCGMSQYRGRVATQDAPAVAALRQADAIILGKTNVPTQLAGPHSTNPLYGSTTNPWDPLRSAGGSSGGSAAAVAAGFSALDLASDLNGSIRLPSSWCGVVGFRPSPGVISKRGHLPWPPFGGLEPPASVPGPIARSIQDLRLAALVLSQGTIGSADRPHRDPSKDIAVWYPSPEIPVDTLTLDAFSDTLDVLADGGWTIHTYRPPIEPNEIVALGWRLALVEIAHGLSEEQWNERYPYPVDVRTYLADLENQLQLRLAGERSIAPHGLLLCPATPTSSIPIDQIGATITLDGDPFDVSALWSWSLATSVMHLPSVTLPTPHRPGTLPVGVQVIAGNGADDQLLDACESIMDLIGPIVNPPMSNLAPTR
ncbi:MAG: amidase [Ferrimicrobium sp.]